MKKSITLGFLLTAFLACSYDDEANNQEKYGVNGVNTGISMLFGDTINLDVVREREICRSNSLDDCALLTRPDQLASDDFNSIFDIQFQPFSPQEETVEVHTSLFSTVSSSLDLTSDKIGYFGPNETVYVSTQTSQFGHPVYELYNLISLPEDRGIKFSYVRLREVWLYGSNIAQGLGSRGRNTTRILLPNEYDSRVVDLADLPRGILGQGAEPDLADRVYRLHLWSDVRVTGLDRGDPEDETDDRLFGPFFGGDYVSGNQRTASLYLRNGEGRKTWDSLTVEPYNSDVRWKYGVIASVDEEGAEEWYYVNVDASEDRTYATLNELPGSGGVDYTAAVAGVLLPIGTCITGYEQDSYNENAESGEKWRVEGIGVDSWTEWVDLGVDDGTRAWRSLRIHPCQERICDDRKDENYDDLVDNCDPVQE